MDGGCSGRPISAVPKYSRKGVMRSIVIERKMWLTGLAAMGGGNNGSTA